MDNNDYSNNDDYDNTQTNLCEGALNGPLGRPYGAPSYSVRRSTTTAARCDTERLDFRRAQSALLLRAELNERLRRDWLNGTIRTDERNRTIETRPINEPMTGRDYNCDALSVRPARGRQSKSGAAAAHSYVYVYGHSSGAQLMQCSRAIHLPFFSFSILPILITAVVIVSVVIVVVVARAIGSLRYRSLSRSRSSSVRIGYYIILRT